MESKTKTKWHLIGTIKSSNYREKVLRELTENTQTPKWLAKKTNIKFSHISTVLTELQKLKLIKCLTPELRKGRIYSITKLGKEILKSLSKLD